MILERSCKTSHKTPVMINHHSQSIIIFYLLSNPFVSSFRFINHFIRVGTAVAQQEKEEQKQPTHGYCRLIRSIDKDRDSTCVMPIDYSKWDYIEDDDSDSDGNAWRQRQQPRVTRLDAPSKVTFGGGGGDDAVNVEKTIQSSSTTAAVPSSLKPPTTPPRPPATKAVASCPSSSSIPPDSSWTENGGVVVAKTTTTRDENQSRNLYWCQDRYSVSLRLQLNEGEKVASVQVDGILKYADRYSAVGTTIPRLTCIGTTTTTTTAHKSNDAPQNKLVLLEGTLPHPVHYAEDDEDEVDWSIVVVNCRSNDSGSNSNNSNARYLLITLYKAVPMTGLFVWWKRPMMEFPEVEVREVSEGAASKEFLRAWEEAHNLFRRQRQRRQEEHQEGQEQPHQQDEQNNAT